MVILEARGVSKHFDSLAAVDRVDLQVSEGSIHAIIGPNGAGKTTLFNLLTGCLPLSRGEVLFKGKSITHLPAYRVSKLGIARSFQITSIFPNLSVFENLRLAAQSNQKGTLNFIKDVRSLPRAGAKADEILLFIGLHEKRNVVAANLAYGEKRTLDIGIALATDPAILLLDEPMAGLSSADLEWMIRLVKSISTHLTVVLIDHNIDLIITLSDRITVMSQGRVIAEGTPEEIQNNEEVQEAYLGGY